MACSQFDVGCQVVALITPWVLPAVIFIVSLVGIVASKSLKGKVFWGLVILLLVWYFVPITGFTLRQVLGLPPNPYFGDGA